MKWNISNRIAAISAVIALLGLIVAVYSSFSAKKEQPITNISGHSAGYTSISQVDGGEGGVTINLSSNQFERSQRELLRDVCAAHADVWSSFSAIVSEIHIRQSDGKSEATEILKKQLVKLSEAANKTDDPRLRKAAHIIRVKLLEFFLLPSGNQLGKLSEPWERLSAMEHVAKEAKYINDYCKSQGLPCNTEVTTFSTEPNNFFRKPQQELMDLVNSDLVNTRLILSKEQEKIYQNSLLIPVVKTLRLYFDKISRNEIKTPQQFDYQDASKHFIVLAFNDYYLGGTILTIMAKESPYNIYFVLVNTDGVSKVVKPRISKVAQSALEHHLSGYLQSGAGF